MFATRAIPKNKNIIQYTGELVNAQECNRRDKNYERQGEMWLFWINRAWAVDAHVGGNNARFINHSDKPNCWVDIRRKEIWYRASRTIRMGEELTVDYGVELPRARNN